LCGARGRKVLENGHAQMALKSGKTGHNQPFDEQTD
jgi:hypothetical protein